ncbi:hypothetical protein [Streptomyces xiamenensis]|uniref:hypothetical protein n=1 Tax=Streptomyces xiamenensis TaxID=408015 RepID=UPI003D74E5DF
MSDQQPARHPDPMTAAPVAYVAPRAGGVSDAYRRWAGILLGLAIALGALMVVAFLASVVLLVVADRDTGTAAYGYLALILWVAIAAAMPLLIALAVPGAVMTQRARQQRRAPHTGAPDARTEGAHPDGTLTTGHTP